MASRIKGITIEINGETKGLDKALSNVTKQSASTAKELKDVNKLLKLNPGNTELLAQKQTLLSKAVKTTSEKLEGLKGAQAQVEAQFKKGDIGEEQYRSFQRELQATEGQLNGYQSELAQVEGQQNKLSQSTDNATNSTKRMHVSMDQVAEKSMVAGKALSIGLTAPLVGVATAGVKSFKDITTIEEAVIRQTGATGKEADALRKSFENVAGNSAADFEDIGNAVGGVKQRFNLTGKELEKASSQFLTFAAVNKVDVESSVRLVGRAMGDAGIKSSEYGKVLDMLTVAHQKSGVEVDRLAENLAKYGAPMRQLGFDTKSSIAIFAGWEKAGVNTEIAFSGMKKAISNWGKEGKKPMEEFPKAMQKIKNSTNPVADAIKIFGAKAGPDLADAITQGRFSFEDYAKALDKSNGALQKSANETGNPFKDFTKVMHNLQIVLGNLGKEIMGTVAPTLKNLIPSIQGLTKWFKELSPGAKKAALAIGAILISIGPALIVFSKIIIAVQRVKQAFMVVGGAFKTLGLLMSANPFGAVIIAITAVVGALVWFFTQTKTGRQMWKGFTTWLTGLWQGVASFFKGLWQGITDTFNNAVKWVSQFLQGPWGQALMFLINPIGGIVNFIIQHWDQIKQVTTAVFSAIGQFLSGVWNGIKTAVSTVVSGIGTAISIVWNGIRNTTSSVFNGIRGVAVGIWNGIKGAITGVVNGIKGTISGVWNGIKSLTSAVWNGIKSAMTSPISAAKGVISGIVNGIKGLFNIKLKFPKIEIPHIPLPHFSLKGSFNPLKGKIPSIGIDWHAKGGIFNKPTLFNTPTGMHGVGEAGPEAVLPLNADTLAGIGKGIAEQMNTSNGTTNFNEDEFITRLTVAIVTGLSQVRVDMNQRTVGQMVADEVDARIGNKIHKKRRGVAG